MALLLLLAIFAGIFPFFGGMGALGINPGQGPRGQMQGNLPEGMLPPNDGNFQPGQDNFTPPSGSNGNVPNGGINRPQGANMPTQMKLLQLERYAIAGAVILFGVLSVVGLWLDKKWGKTLTIITGAGIIAATIPSLFRMMGGISLIESIVKIVLALAAIILVIIPSKKPTLIE